MIQKHKRIHYRIKSRNKDSRPILSVYKTEKHIYAQIIKDNNTVCSASSVNHNDIKGYNMSGATVVGQKIGKLAIEKGIKNVAFDRGQHVYHGRIAALADGAREFLEF